MKPTIPVLVIFLGLVSSCIQARPFVNKGGKSLEAEAVSKTETHVTLKTSAGKEYSILTSTLSEKEGVGLVGWVMNRGKMPRERPAAGCRSYEVLGWQIGLRN